jgi:peptide/nickel transport system ATP-binding protein
LEQIFDKTSHPYTLGLFGSLPQLDSTERRLRPIKGLMPDPSNLPKGCRFCERCPDLHDKCEREPPVDIEIEPGHVVKCHKFAGTAKEDS